QFAKALQFLAAIRAAIQMFTNLDATPDLSGAADGVVHVPGQICANDGALHGSSSLAELSRANLLRAETVLVCGPKCGAKAGRGMRLEAEEDALKRAPTFARAFECAAALPWSAEAPAASASSCAIAGRSFPGALAERSTSSGSSRSFSARRPRRMRDFTVPALHSSTSAISS